MKKPLLTLGCALAAAWSFAAPAPRWAPANTDLLLVAESAGKPDPAAEAAWRKAFKAEGFDLEQEESRSKAQLEEISPSLPALFKAFGTSDDLKTLPTWSLVYSVTLPSAHEQMKGDDFPKGAALRLFLENAKIDVPALDKLMADLCADPQKDARVTCTFGRSGEWRTFTFASKEKGKVPAKMFMGYRPVEGGLAVIVCATQAEADAWVAGKAPTLPANSPLASAFTPVEGTKKDWGRLCVADLAGLLNRLSTPEARKELAIKMPLVLKTHKVDLAFAQKGSNYLLALSATTDDEASATQLRDFLLGWKGLLAQMILPMATQKPNSALAALVNAIVCEAKGKDVSLRLEVTPELGAKAFKECQAMAAAQQTARQTVPSQDDDEAEDEDDDEAPLSEEKAHEILKPLESK